MNEQVQPDVLLDAAWMALSTVCPENLARLNDLLECPLGKDAMDPRKMRRLELLLQATARNLRMLRREFRFDSY